jgi:hypothetical protein
MAVHENVTLQSCKVRITAGVASAIVDRFCIRDTTAGRVDEMITHVPGANGAAAVGIIGMAPDTVRSTFSGTVVTSYVRPDGAEAIVELGEIVTTLGAPLRVGGNSTEVDGAAYLADATGDVVVGFAAETGVVGQKIRFQFTGYSGVRP